MIIKVCGLRDLGNIKDIIVNPSPDWIGMIFYPPSPRYVKSANFTPSDYAKINVEKVGVFVNEGLQTIGQIVKEYGLNKIQLHGDETPKLVEDIKKSFDSEVIKVFRVGQDWRWEKVEPYLDVADWILFDTATPQYGGSGNRFDWEVIEDYPFEKPFLLSGGIDEDHKDGLLELAKKQPKMKGIDINSKFEQAPGLKELDKVKRFIEYIRSSEATEEQK